jgi:hypothetical protein
MQRIRHNNRGIIGGAIFYAVQPGAVWQGPARQVICEQAAIHWGREHRNRRTSMISSRNLATPSEYYNQAVAKEGITDRTLACATAIWCVD